MHVYPSFRRKSMCGRRVDAPKLWFAQEEEDGVVGDGSVVD